MIIGCFSGRYASGISASIGGVGRSISGSGRVSRSNYWSTVEIIARARARDVVSFTPISFGRRGRRSWGIDGGVGFRDGA